MITRNFEFYISPKASEPTPVLIAFRIQGPYLSFYLKGTFRELYRDKLLKPFADSVIKATNCEQEYNDKDPSAFSYLTSGAEDFEEHSKLHETLSEDESNVVHVHFKFDHDVTLEDLQKFLDHMKKCEISKKLKKNQTFITAVVREELLREYDTYLRTYKNIDYFASNNKIFKLLSPSFRPGIGEYEKFLRTASFDLPAARAQSALISNQQPIQSCVSGTMALLVFATFGIFRILKKNFHGDNAKNNSNVEPKAVKR